MATVSEENLPDDSSETSASHFLDAVSDQSATTTTWHIRVKVNGKEVVFKIDTGAEVTAISKDVYKAIGHPKLQRPNKVLCVPNKQPLNVLGCIAVHLVYEQRSLRHHVYVIDSLNQNLVSCPDRFFSYCVGAEEKGSGGSPIHFLCSRIYNFWGSLISGDG